MGNEVEGRRKPGNKAEISVCDPDVTVWGLDCLPLERQILKELRFAAI